jgi:hypothetical protein
LKNEKIENFIEFLTINLKYSIKPLNNEISNVNFITKDKKLNIHFQNFE